jgi:hypothetical protein
VFTGGERSLGIVREERSFLAALLRMTANNGEGKKKQVPHPSALRAYGLRMTAKSKSKILLAICK